MTVATIVALHRRNERSNPVTAATADSADGPAAASASAAFQRLRHQCRANLPGPAHTRPYWDRAAAAGAASPVSRLFPLSSLSLLSPHPKPPRVSVSAVEPAAAAAAAADVAAARAAAPAARLRCSCVQLQAGLAMSAHVWPSWGVATATVRGVPPFASALSSAARTKSKDPLR